MRRGRGIGGRCDVVSRTAWDVRCRMSDVRSSNSGSCAIFRRSDIRHLTTDIGQEKAHSILPTVPALPPTVPTLLVALTLFLSACGYYSFTGATIPEHLDSVAIPLTEDVSANPFSDLGGTMTRRLVDRFVGQTRLRLETDETQADALLTTEIQRYVIEPTAVGGDNTAELNRLTIAALATYVDRENNEQVFERTFSASVEYNPANLATEEEAALEAIDNIAEDIFTAATSNW